MKTEPLKVKVKIECPKCGTVQDAYEEKSWPWWIYIHTCEKCGYVIMESEWIKTKE